MTENIVSFCYKQLKERVLPDGGFLTNPGGGYRADATCWAILALSGDPDSHGLLARARTRLAADQLPDGRVCISSDHPEAAWPTSLAIFAWHQSAEHLENQVRAADFLVTSSGTHWERTADSPSPHDTSIKGWPWITDTHSWAEPTALAMMALKIAGYGGHERVKEAIRLLLDRQLPRGGWNFGSTIIYDLELRPMPLSTGLVLNALKDLTALETIQHSLAYLQFRVTSLQTPRSLGWSLLGLGAWKTRHELSRPLIDACLKNQARYGAYDTTSLSLLLVASKSPGGLEEIFSETGKS
jgi:hypothetical protein